MDSVEMVFSKQKLLLVATINLVNKQKPNFLIFEYFVVVKNSKEEFCSYFVAILEFSCLSLV